MKWYLAAAPVAVMGLLLFSVAFSQDDSLPDWLRSSAGWWADGLISDADYLASLQWLVDEGFITLDGNDVQRLVRVGAYSIDQPRGWERQAPIVDETQFSIRDSMIHRDTIDYEVPAMISVSAYRMLGENMTEHRQVGLELVYDYFGEAFTHNRAETIDVVGNPGYVDEYMVSFFGLSIQGISYSFEHEDLIYEIKYETSAEDFSTYLDEFERILQTYSLE